MSWDAGDILTFLAVTALWVVTSIMLGFAGLTALFQGELAAERARDDAIFEALADFEEDEA